MGTWSAPKDPTVYGWLDLEASAAVQYIEKTARESGVRVTLTHFVGRAIAEVYRRHPALNCLLRHGKLYPREDIDIYFTVATDPEGKDLSGAVVRQGDQKGLAQFALDLARPVADIRAGRAHPLKRVLKIASFFPNWLTRPLIAGFSFVLFTLNRYVPLLGMPRDPFGSVIISNIGSLGLDTAFPPLVGMTRVPVLVSICRLRDEPVVRDGAITIGHMLRLGFTIDHRVVDGAPLGPMAQTLQSIFAHPEKELSR